jgi:hypothetical protein
MGEKNAWGIIGSYFVLSIVSHVFFTTGYLISIKEFDDKRTSQATTGNGPVTYSHQ